MSERTVAAAVRNPYCGCTTTSPKARLSTSAGRVLSGQDARMPMMKPASTVLGLTSTKRPGGGGVVGVGVGAGAAAAAAGAQARTQAVTTATIAGVRRM